jgi:glycosyltransferase involved in cell wall biosynthesis
METRVGVNARFLYRRTTGVERYAGEVARRLARCGQVRLLKPGRPWQGPLGQAWEQAVLPGQLESGETLWSPANTGPLLVSRQAVTIHDAAVFDHPEWFDPQFAAWYRWLLPRLARRAALVLTVSTFSKIRILETFRISEQRVKVAPGGVDPDRFRPAPPARQAAVHSKYGLPRRYLLIVGSLEPRKNLDLAFQAWRQAAGRAPDVALAVVGAGGRAFRPAAWKELPPGVRFLGAVSDEDLAALYSGAAAFLQASLYEGFALPALEAMACGAPVIAARAGALPEVIGEAGLFFDPFDFDALAWAIRSLLDDEGLAGELRAKGFARARLYSWDQTARAVWDALELVAGR